MTYAVPFATTPWDEIAPGLYQGGHTTDRLRKFSSTSPVVVRDEFDLVVSLYTCWGHGPAEGVEELRATIPDGALSVEQMAKVVALVPHIVSALGDGKKVLVRCQAGYNRSGLVVGLVLMTLGATADEAIKLIRERRSEHALCNPHFVEYLRINEWSNANPASVEGSAETSNAALGGAS